MKQNKDTPEWRAHYLEVEKHKARMEAKRPDPNKPGYFLAKAEWDWEYAMNMPNEPGYYRANND